jgi:SMC interacting uncharacterized protein involved in chromosome segregation
MKLTRAAATIIGEDSGGSLCSCIAELEKNKDTLKLVVNHGIEDYDLLLAGNEKLASEHDKLKYCCEDLHVELMEARSDAQKRIDDLEVKVKPAEAHVDVAANGGKCLREFKNELV